MGTTVGDDVTNTYIIECTKPMQNGRRNSTTKPGPEDRCRPVHYWPLQRLKVNEMKSKFIVVNEEEAASFVDDHHPFYLYIISPGETYLRTQYNNNAVSS